MTAAEAAARLGLSAETIRRYCWSKRIAAEHHGRDWWITEEALTAFSEWRAPALGRGRPRTTPTGDRAAGPGRGREGDNG